MKSWEVEFLDLDVLRLKHAIDDANQRADDAWKMIDDANQRAVKAELENERLRAEVENLRAALSAV